MVQDTDISTEILNDKNLLLQQIEKIKAHIENEKDSLREYSFDIVENKELSSFQINIVIKTTARTKTFKLNQHFIGSPEYIDLLNMYDGLKKYVNANYKVTNEKKEPVEFDRLYDLSNYILESGKQGAYIQRYKGLGEMNPEQLWETTMNPENRNLLQVKIDDTIEADQVFSVLMGDNVEPRREFVETNALNVRNLDV